MTTHSQMTMRVEELIAGLARGDKTARNDLFQYAEQRFRKLARTILRKDFKRVGRYVDTDDVLQEALKKLCQRLENYKPPDLQSFHRLVSQQLRRALFDLARHHFGKHGSGTHHRSDAGPGGDPDRRFDPVAPISADPAGVAEWTELHESAEHIPNDLRQRDVFDFRYYDGLSVKEVAEALGISESLVKLRWAEALAWLRHHLDGKELPGM